MLNVIVARNLLENSAVHIPYHHSDKEFKLESYSK